MSNSKKLYTAQEAALAVLAKTKELLEKSELAKAEKLAKYESDMKKEPSKAPKSKAEALERDYKDFEVKAGKSKEKDNRLAEQVAPDKNSKEDAEGNNKPDGMEPEYQFKDKVKKELAKEKAAHMGKAENPDKEADAKLGEDVEKLCEQHFKENKEAEEKEGHKLMVKKEECHRCKSMEKAGKSYPKELAAENIKEHMKHKGEHPGGAKQAIAIGIEQARHGEHEAKKSSEEHEGDVGFPKLVVSSKLAKFMERKHAKRKAAVDKAEKGVHGREYQFAGTTGNMVRAAHSAKQLAAESKNPSDKERFSWNAQRNIEDAKTAHKQVLGEIKEMSSKDRSGMGKVEKAETGYEKGVHTKHSNAPGTSKAGFFVRSKRPGQNTPKHMEDKQRARSAHSDVIFEQRQMSSKDRSGMGKVEKAETGYEKGVHKQYRGAKLGTSEAGVKNIEVKAGNLLEPKSKDPMYAKAPHKQVLGEIKEMSSKDRSGMGKKEK